MFDGRIDRKESLKCCLKTGWNSDASLPIYRKKAWNLWSVVYCLTLMLSGERSEILGLAPIVPLEIYFKLLGPTWALLHFIKGFW